MKAEDVIKVVVAVSSRAERLLLLIASVAFLLRSRSGLVLLDVILLASGVIIVFLDELSTIFFRTFSGPVS
jgi:hypothetical protein